MSLIDHEASILANKEKEIYRAINEETHVFSEDEKATRIYTGYCHPLFRIESFIKSVSKCKHGPFENTENDNSEYYFGLSELGKECILLTGLPIEQYNKKFDYSEHVKVFFDVFFKMGLTGGIFNKESCVDLVVRKNLLKKFFEQVKDEVSSEGFKKRLKMREDNCERNIKSVRNYAIKLFEKHARLLVLRIDLGYKKSISDEVTDWAAHEHLKKFLNNMRSNSLFNHMRGYIWKLEYGEGKGHHFHFVFFFDGSKVQKDAHLARKIGEYWVTRIMKNEGVYHNCNMHKSTYRNIGIGMLKYHEKEKIDTLLTVLDYLAKKDQFLRVRTKSGCRVLGKKINPSKVITNRGRPRESEVFSYTPTSDAR